MYTGLGRLWPSRAYDYSRVTHPALEQELRPFEPLGFTVLGILAIINGGAIVVLWKTRNRKLTETAVAVATFGSVHFKCYTDVATVGIANGSGQLESELGIAKCH